MPFLPSSDVSVFSFFRRRNAANAPVSDVIAKALLEGDVTVVATAYQSGEFHFDLVDVEDFFGYSDQIIPVARYRASAFGGRFLLSGEISLEQAGLGEVPEPVVKIDDAAITLSPFSLEKMRNIARSLLAERNIVSSSC